jgi:hypothetical protein
MNKKSYSLRVWSIFAWIILLAASEASPAFSKTTQDFSVGSDFGARLTVPITIKEQGCIWASLTWPESSTAKTLALILNGPGSNSAYQRKDGQSGVVLYYSVTADNIKKDTNWSISIANFGGGTAKGKITIEYPPNQVPCELKAVTSKTKGQIALSWVYTGKLFKGSFLIERSTDNKTWSVISSCTKPLPASSKTTSTSYSCTDSGLSSNRTYYYRVCSIMSGSKCDPQKYTTPAMSLKTP